jgi:1-acyl-sn-glycerol-3-phosphate acyltransferase
MWCQLEVGDQSGDTKLTKERADVSEPSVGRAEVHKWDPGFTERMIGVVRPVLKRWFRSEVRGLEVLPPGGALVVSNHSGGAYAVDALVFAADFYAKFGYDRPLYTLSNEILFKTPIADRLIRSGFVPATPANAAEAARSGGILIVFPGGDFDAYRTTRSANKIDFAGRTGYVRVAIEAGVPIVPVVSIGAQENQLYLARGDWLAKRLGIKRRFGTHLLPITFGLPFGLNVVLPLNLPLPTKIITQVIEPIDVIAEFGKEPDVDEVDRHIRSLMQTALEELASKRRFPVLG